MNNSVSTAAQIQVYQSRARMAGALFRQLAGSVIVGWLAFNFFVIWYAVGHYFPNLHHEYFFHWIFCSFAVHLPTGMQARLSMPIAWHQWMPLKDLAPQLFGPEFYHATFLAWFAHYAKWTGFMLVLIGIIATVLWWVRPGNSEHLRGLQIVSAAALSRELHGGLLQRRFRKPSGLMIGQHVIPEAECERMLVSGMPGSGKTTLIRQVLKQAEERGHAAIVLDRESEYVQEYYRPERGDVILNPLDARFPSWDFWNEFRPQDQIIDIKAMAASLIRGKPRDANQEFFLSSGKRLLEATFTILNKESISSVTEFFLLDRTEIHKAIRHTPAYSLVDPGAAEQGTGIVSTAINAIEPFYLLPPSGGAQPGWSAREWAAQERKGWIFLTSKEDGRAAVEALQGVWFDSLVRWLMSAQIYNSDQKVLVVADELPALGYQAQILQLASRARKRQIWLAIGFQNAYQLYDLYGEWGALSLISPLTTKILLRVDEFNTADFISRAVGAHEIQRMETTAIAGVSAYREGVNIQSRKDEERLVSPAEIQKLKSFEGYLCIAGHNRSKIQIEPNVLKPAHPDFVRRTPIDGEQTCSA